MSKSLLDPVIITDATGVTLLSGENVTLAPQALSAALMRLPGPGRGRSGSLPFLAFAQGRQGLVGCQGRIDPCEAGTVLCELETFGARSGLRAFGHGLAGLIGRPGRFDGLPGLAPVAGAGTGVDLLVEGLLRGGLRAWRGPEPENGGLCLGLR